MTRSRLARALAVAALCGTILAGCAGRLPGDSGRFVELKVLAINDFHGNLEAPRNDSGGAAYLAAHLRRAEAAAPNAVIVSAGDLIGATPLISSLFHDEPTIEAASLWGLDFNGVGNHEFDEGSEELLRMQHGGPHPVDGRSSAGEFAGAAFRFLGANVIEEESGKTLFPPYAIERYEGIPVAFIGLTLENTPGVSSVAAMKGLSFRDEADTVNALVPEIRERGIEAIVVLIHEGGFQSSGDEDRCEDFVGPIIDIVKRTDPAVDLFVTGHTHRHYLCRVDGRPVTSTGNAGRFYTDIDTRLDRRTGDMTVLRYDNVPVTQDIEPAPDVEALVEKYRALSEALSNRVVGSITGDFTKDQDDAGQSLLGGLIADAQLYASSLSTDGKADVSFMNPGGIRSNLPYESSGAGRDGEITYGEVFAVHPFGNHLVTMTLTGAQVHTVLEQQWANRQGGQVLMPSQGFSYSWSRRAPRGARVDPGSVRLHGNPLEPEATYRVTVNSFLADGGDGFPVFLEGSDRIDGVADIDALQGYLEARSPLGPTRLDRIRVLP